MWLFVMLLVRQLFTRLPVTLLVTPLMRLAVILLAMLDVSMLTKLVLRPLTTVDVVLLVTLLAKLLVMPEVTPVFVPLPAPMSRSATIAEAIKNRVWTHIFFMQCIPLCGRTDWSGGIVITEAILA